LSYDKKNLNGWALPEEAFKWILENIPEGSTILELGSGTGTKELVKHYIVYSVEQDLKWVGFVNDAHYIHSPLVDGWYNEDIFEQLPKSYSLLIVDGPIGRDRANFLKHCEKFLNVPFLIDDTQRSVDRKMAEEVAKKLNRTFIEIEGHEKKFIILNKNY
jgi:hypothetical protein